MHRVKSLLLIVALGASTASAAPLPGGTLDPLSIPKYVQPLVVPPPMPEVVDPLTGLAVPNTYDIAVRQFFQQVLPPGFPTTKVWGYGAVNAPATFNYPAFTILAKQGTPTTVTWRNELVADPVACRAIVDPLVKAIDPACNFVPHFLPIDQTLHWANPAMDCRVGEIGPDCRGNSTAQYTGPVPIVTHLHGGHIDPLVDGYPEAWYLPDANNIAGYAAGGSNYPTGLWAPGTAVYTYRNDQRGTTLWYHDHALGITRANVQTGMAGFYFLRDDYELDLINGTNVTGRNALLQKIPSGAQEIPLAIQDRSFNADGSIFFPDTRAFFDGFAGPYYPTSDVPPTWNPEYFGNTMVVNGRTWPFHNVEPRRYRLRLLNGTDSRFLILQFADAKGRPIALPISIIGNDGGFVPRKPVTVPQLVIGPGERYDTIVDFAAFAGTSVMLQNVGPDSPWGGGAVPAALRADPATTGQVMLFNVAPAPLVKLVDPVPPAGKLVLNQPPDPFGAPAATGTARTLTLNEIVTALPFGGPIEAQLGDWQGPLPWRAAITEFPPVGSTEIWNLVNRTVDSHPIHLHQVQFVVMDRTPIDLAAWDAAVAACAAAPGTCPPTGPDPMAFALRGALPLPANAWEAGAKDTVITNPGEITRVRAFFDIPGLYVWHCHILSHEDNEMMRQFCVGGGCLK